MERLSDAKVIVFGIGGVGSWCAEALVRTGVKHLTIVDPDTVSETNVNRQLMATCANVGAVKVEIMKDRLLEINPDAEIIALQKAYSLETAAEFDLDGYDCIVDCIDSLRDKERLILAASASESLFFSSMGAALKTDPTRVRVAKFWDVRGCPMAAMIRKKFRKEKTLPSRDFLCVYDDEVLPNLGPDGGEDPGKKAVINGSIVPVTGIFGFTLAAEVIRALL